MLLSHGKHHIMNFGNGNKHKTYFWSLKAYHFWHHVIGWGRPRFGSCLGRQYWGLGELQAVSYWKAQVLEADDPMEELPACKYWVRKRSGNGEATNYAWSFRRKKGRESTQPRLRWEERWVSLTTKGQVEWDRVISR